jgi:adenylate cyclase
MATLNVRTVAERAGVTPEYVEQLVALGALRPDGEGFSEGHVRQVRIIEGLVGDGLPLERLAEALRRGDLTLDFVNQPGYDRFASLTDTTFRELSARSGVPLELVLTIREAMGFAEASPDDRVRESELAVVPQLQLQVEEGVRPQVIERSLRVHGDALRRLAETQAAWWSSDILGPLYRAGLGAGEIGQRVEAFANASGPADDASLLALYHGHQSAAWMRNIFEGVETTLVRAGLHTALERPPAICFLDLTGYTRLTAEQGDDAAAELAGSLARIVQRISANHGGKAVKWLGDGVMFFFPDPGPGVRAALEMVTAAAAADLPPAHVGLHAGAVLFQEGDYFGGTVNAASRIADYARQGEVVVSQQVVDASKVDDVRFDRIGPVDLKGLAEPLVLFSSRRAEG